MRRDAKTDGNQSNIVKGLRCDPYLRVHLTHTLGGGFPDIAVGDARGIAFPGVYLMEIKTAKGNLTGKEPAWHADWTGNVAIPRTFSEAYEVVLEGRRRRETLQRAITMLYACLDHVRGHQRGGLDRLDEDVTAVLVALDRDFGEMR